MKIKFHRINYEDKYKSNKKIKVGKERKKEAKLEKEKTEEKRPKDLNCVKG